MGRRLNDAFTSACLDENLKRSVNCCIVRLFTTNSTPMTGILQKKTCAAISTQRETQNRVSVFEFQEEHYRFWGMDSVGRSVDSKAIQPFSKNAFEACTAGA